MPTTDLHKEKGTIVRIWTSGFNYVRTRGSGVGHVSVETRSPNRYMSLWPQRKEEQTSSPTFFGGTPHKTAVTLSRDNIWEERPAEYCISLYSLSTQRIVSHFETAFPRIQGWHLLSGNLLMCRDLKSTENCASLALKLLLAGGIKPLTTSCNTYTVYKITTPDGLLELVRSAKVAERKKYPETAHWSVSEEEPLSTCTIL